MEESFFAKKVMEMDPDKGKLRDLFEIALNYEYIFEVALED